MLRERNVGYAPGMERMRACDDRSLVRLNGHVPRMTAFSVYTGERSRIEKAYRKRLAEDALKAIFRGKCRHSSVGRAADL